MTTYSILVVDDEPDNFDVIESLLPSESYQLHYVMSGEQAIASLDKFDPDVILLDVMMPGLDGIEVCRQIKAMSKWQSLPIVMVTALSGKEDLARCLGAGADDFVTKPVSGLELRARVNSMIRIKKQHDRIQSFSKLQRHNIHSLATNLNEIRLDLAVSFSNEFALPLNIILDNNQHLAENIKDLRLSATQHILEQNNQATFQLQKLIQKLCFYLQLVAEKTAPNYERASSPKPIFEQALVNRFEGLIKADRIICEIENVELAVSLDRFQWICDELIEHIFDNDRPHTYTRIYGEVIDDIFHLSLSNSPKNNLDRSAVGISNSIQLTSSTYEERELKIGLKIAKKIVNNYDGIFLLSSDEEEETTVYLTLPLVPGRLPSTESQLKESVISMQVGN
jgi:two-component system, sensor histidine kinase and response regulator